MNDMWSHVTPTSHGVYNTKIFCDGCLSYAKSRNLKVDCEHLDIPPRYEVRPSLTDILAFVRRGIDSDIPVAFLSLDNGKESRIDKWHWMTIIAVQTSRENNSTERFPENTIYQDQEITIDFLDEGKIKHADLSNWYLTTAEGGGFVTVRPLSNVKDQYD